MDTSSPSYLELDNALSQLETIGTPSDMHGLLCAFFCGGVVLSQKAWVDSMLMAPIAVGDSLGQEAREVLVRFFENTQDAFENQLEGFELVLPDDEISCEVRLSALVSWVQGFLSGLRLLGVDHDKDYGQEINEVLQDLLKISVLATDDVGCDEEVEASLMELSEFTKVGLQLLLTEKAKWSHSHAQSSNTLH